LKTLRPEIAFAMTVTTAAVIALIFFEREIATPLINGTVLSHDKE
jgi:hypothetical protein